METFSALLAICVGNSRWIPHTKASDAELWCFLWSDLRLNKRLSKQSWGWRFETPSCLLWPYVTVMKYMYKLRFRKPNNHLCPRLCIRGESVGSWCWCFLQRGIHPHSWCIQLIPFSYSNAGHWQHRFYMYTHGCIVSDNGCVFFSYEIHTVILNALIYVFDAVMIYAPLFIRLQTHWTPATGAPIPVYFMHLWVNLRTSLPSLLRHNPSVAVRLEQ